MLEIVLVEFKLVFVDVEVEENVNKWIYLIIGLLRRYIFGDRFYFIINFYKLLLCSFYDINLCL